MHGVEVCLTHIQVFCCKTPEEDAGGISRRKTPLMRMHGRVGGLQFFHG